MIYNGAKITNIYPFPLYPGLQKFADSPEVKALVEKYQPRKFDLEESAKLMTAAGFTKNGDGLWEKDGKTVPGAINGFEGIHADIVPVLVEMLRTGGFDASHQLRHRRLPEHGRRQAWLVHVRPRRQLDGSVCGVRAVHSRYSAPIGTTAGNNRFCRYKNPEFDKLVDEMAPLARRRSEVPRERGQGDGDLLEGHDRHPDHPVAASHSLQPDLLGQLANRGQRWPGCNGAFWAHTGYAGDYQPEGRWLRHSQPLSSECHGLTRATAHARSLRRSLFWL